MTNQFAIISREQVDHLAVQYLEFLPGARDLPPEGRLALAHLSMAHGLDPFLKECWAIASKNRQGEIVGFELMVGITGWRRAAHDSGEYWGRRFEPCTDEERKWLNVGPDDLAIKCIVMRRKSGQQPMEFDGYGVFRKGEFIGKMTPLQKARLRAERDGMKAAFPITLNMPGGKINVVDDAGDIIDGDIVIAPEQPESPPDEQEHPSEEAQSHAPVEVDVTQAPSKPAEQDGNGKVKSAKSASIAASVLTRWRQAAQALADEFPYYRYENGEPNRYRILSVAGQMDYREINESTIEAALDDLRRHAREQEMQEVPA